MGKIQNNQSGFTAVEGLLVVLVLAVIGFGGYYVWHTQQSKNTATPTSTNSAKNIQQSQSTTEPKKEVSKTTIYPNVETDTGAAGTSKDLFYTAALPTGWSVQSGSETYDVVKNVGDDKYLISSSIEHNGGPNSSRNLMEQRVAEGSEVITSVQTSSGTSVSVLKTPSVLFLATCKPTGENCYLQLNGKQLYVHLYKVVSGAQGLTNTAYPQEIISDFESIAKSLSI